MDDDVDNDSIGLIEDKEENLIVNTEISEFEIEEPKIGMEFNFVDELMSFYVAYAKEKAFSVCKRSSKKVDDILTYMLLSCNSSGTPKIVPSDPLLMRLNIKTDCKAKISACKSREGMWCVRGIELNHNHVMSPYKSRYYKCNRYIKPHVKRRLILNDEVGIRINKSFNSCVVEAGGRDKLSFIEKYVRNLINSARRLQLGKGDANAMHNYFLRIQNDNSDFFYLMDLDQNGQLKNVFWADARSRAIFKEFGDVDTFDTTYLVNNYNMSFAAFLEVNHHGNSVLLVCALISCEDTNTFTWLFES